MKGFIFATFAAVASAAAIPTDGTPAQGQESWGKWKSTTSVFSQPPTTITVTLPAITQYETKPIPPPVTVTVTAIQTQACEISSSGWGAWSGPSTFARVTTTSAAPKETAWVKWVKARDDTSSHDEWSRSEVDAAPKAYDDGQYHPEQYPGDDGSYHPETYPGQSGAYTPELYPGDGGQYHGEKRSDDGFYHPENYPGQSGAYTPELYPGDDGQYHGEKRSDDGFYHPESYPGQSGAYTPELYPGDDDGQYHGGKRSDDGFYHPENYPGQSGAYTPELYPGDDGQYHG